jgi:hypothetical protein
MPDYPRAVVREVGGQLVLDDPDALAVIQVVESHNRGIARQACEQLFNTQAERVEHFKRRIIERGSSPDELIIVLLDVDDPNGGRLANILMPNNEKAWQAFRDQGQIPLARGMATRPEIQKLVNALDKQTGARLAEMKGKTAVIVMHQGAVEVFEV